MKRRNFALTMATTVATTLLVPPGLRAAVQMPGPAAGWSSAAAATLLTGANFCVQDSGGSRLELIGVETFRADDRQYFARFLVHGSPMPEGTYRLAGPGGPGDLHLQPRPATEQIMEAVICHAGG